MSSLNNNPETESEKNTYNTIILQARNALNVLDFILCIFRALVFLDYTQFKKA